MPSGYVKNSNDKRQSTLLLFCFVLGNQSVANQMYLHTEGECWPVDDLLKRERPQEPVSTISSVLENFSSKEKGDGLIQVGLFND